MILKTLDSQFKMDLFLELERIQMQVAAGLTKKNIYIYTEM